MATRLLARSAGRRAQLLVSQTRCIATFVIAPPKESLAADLLARGDQQQGATAKSLRASTQAVSNRLQWQSIRIDAPRSFEGVCQQESSQARIVTEATWPFRVVYANHAWEELCGWTAEEAVGRHGLAFMQGEDTDPACIRRINEAVREGQRVTVRIVNYKKDGTPFMNSLQITPLRSQSSGEYSHMLGILQEVPLEGDAEPWGHAVAAAGGQQQRQQAATS